MKLPKIVKNIYEVSIEPLGYIASFLGIAYFIKDLISLANKNADNKLFLFILIACILFLIILLVLNIKKIWLFLFYLRDRKKITSLEDSTKSKSIIRDYDKILPSSETLKHIVDKLTTNAKRWSGDAFLNECRLFIWDKEKTYIDLNLSFFSSIKQMKLSISVDKLDLSKIDFDKKAKLSLKKNAGESKPFYLDKMWRKVVITALQASQSMILNNNYTAQISGNYPIGMRIYISPDTDVQQGKVFTYSFNDKKVIESDYPTERVVIDFKKNE